MARPTQVPLGRRFSFRIRVCHPLWMAFPCHSASRPFGNSHVRGPTTPRRKTSTVWAISRSLAATEEIDFSFFSCGYLDVSVLRVRCMHLWIQCMPVRVSRDHRLFDSYPMLIAVFHALQSLLTPRHPPYALSNLTTKIKRSGKAAPTRSRDTQCERLLGGSRLTCTHRRLPSGAAENSTAPKSCRYPRWSCNDKSIARTTCLLLREGSLHEQR